MAIKKYLKILFTLVGILFLALLIKNNWHKLQVVLLNINWLLFILSLLIGFLGNLTASFFFKELMFKYGIDLNTSVVHKIYFYSQMAKYIPGKIWTLFYQLMFLKKDSPKRNIIFPNIDITLTSIVINLVIAMLIISNKYNSYWSIFILLIGMSLFQFIGRTYSIYNIAIYLTDKFKVFNNDLKLDNNLRKSKAIHFYFLILVMYISSSLLMMTAIFDFSIETSVTYIAYLSIAWIMGVLFIIVPGGIGIRELSFILLVQFVSEDSSPELLSIIAIMSRFWIILQELVGIIIIFLWNKVKHS